MFKTIFAQIERPNTIANTAQLAATKEEEKHVFIFGRKNMVVENFRSFSFFFSLLSFFFFFFLIFRRMIVDLDVSRFFIGTERSFSCNSNHFLLSLFSPLINWFPSLLSLPFRALARSCRGFFRAFEGWRRGLDDDDDNDDDEATRGENSLSRNGSGGETFSAPQGTLMIALTWLGNRGRLSTITELSPFRRSPSWLFRPRGSWYPTIDSNNR